MGGRGGSSTLNNSKTSVGDLRLSRREISNLVDTDIEFIKKQSNVYGDLPQGREQEFRSVLKKAYENGFSGLKEGTILDRNPKNQNNYIVKEGNGAAMYTFTPRAGGRVLRTTQSEIRAPGGVVIGDKGKKVKDIVMNNEKRKKYLRRATLLSLVPGR